MKQGYYKVMRQWKPGCCIAVGGVVIRQNKSVARGNGSAHSRPTDAAGSLQGFRDVDHLEKHKAPHTVFCFTAKLSSQSSVKDPASLPPAYNTNNTNSTAGNSDPPAP